MCHYAITREGTRCPCLRSGEKRRGCVLCGLRRAPCVPYRPRAALVDATQPPQDEVHQPAPAAPARRSDEVPFSHLASEIDVEEHQMATTHIPTQLDASETSTRVDDQVQIAAALPDELSSAQKDDADADLREAEERMAELETKRREMLERQLAEQREMDRHLAGEREAFLQKMSLVFDKRVGMR
ncbi:hypothetical protein FA95DRAFT_1285767 [Auriscalpium vulgare]|uniref:Uncharacterized protein n=1 Tax=Auriscalpium vulgare TaxID=40419 RepID=A0ACB8RSH3_9AGAM|nr:hypothetical protein FA95DRAFT_1285767 [Auriscalpium vulgare]